VTHKQLLRSLGPHAPDNRYLRVYMMHLRREIEVDSGTFAENRSVSVTASSCPAEELNFTTVPSMRFFSHTRAWQNILIRSAKNTAQDLCGLHHS
jgi:hypothetical protein